MTQLQKAKRIRALLVQYDYKNCSKWIFDKLTNKIHELMDEENQRKNVHRVEYEKSDLHIWLMASKGLNGRQILIHTK